MFYEKKQRKQLPTPTATNAPITMCLTLQKKKAKILHVLQIIF